MAPDDDLTASLSFGVNLGRSPAEAPDAARRAELAGFDVVTSADHLGSVSPFVMLSAAAAVTSRVRLRTYVLDYGFWNADLLARDVATLDALAAGRVEVGLGAGHMRHEHEGAGLPFPPLAQRMAELEVFAARLRERLADPEHVPEPVQRPVPVFVAAMSDAGLGLAARVGELVALSGLHQVPGRRAPTFTVAGTDRTDERVERVRAARAAAGLSAPRFDVLLQQVVVDRDPQEVADEWAAEDGAPYTAADVLDSPFLLLASSAAEAAEELVRRSVRWGVTSWCTHTPSGPALAEVVAVLRGGATDPGERGDGS